ncbi:glycosyltransferase family 4 protein [Flavobacteriaceae bacterium]|nr:glycosyltransferase family 4 protein [Flavobacteriaceae bacterium]
MAKRILVYTNHYLPEQFKINEIVDWLSVSEFDIRVVTCIPNYSGGKFYKGYGLKSFESHDKKNVIINRLPLIPRGNGNYIRRIFNYASYFISTFIFTIYLMIFKKKYDFIFVHHTSPILIAISPIIYKWFFKTKMFLWDLDLWPDTLKNLDVIKSKIIFNILESLVKYIYSFYDKILIGSQGYKEIVKQRFDGEISYFPNWAEGEIEKNIKTKKITLNIPEEKFVIMYTGNIGVAQGFENVIKLINDLKTENIHWVFIGDGTYKKIFESNINNLGLNNLCSFINQIPVSEIPNYCEIADAMFLSTKDSPLFSRTVPAKLQSYLAVGKPIIGLLHGEGSDIINESKSGIAARNKDYTKLLDKLVELIHLDKSELQKIGKNGHDFYRTKYSSNMRKAELLDLFK